MSGKAETSPRLASQTMPRIVHPCFCNAFTPNTYSAIVSCFKNFQRRFFLRCGQRNTITPNTLPKYVVSMIRMTSPAFRGRGCTVAPSRRRCTHRLLLPSEEPISSYVCFSCTYFFHRRLTFFFFFSLLCFQHSLHRHS